TTPSGAASGASPSSPSPWTRKAAPPGLKRAWRASWTSCVTRRREATSMSETPHTETPEIADGDAGKRAVNPTVGRAFGRYLERNRVNPLRTDDSPGIADGARGARVVLGGGGRGPFRLRPLLPKRPRPRTRERHARTRVAFFRYSYYDIAFKFFV